MKKLIIAIICVVFDNLKITSDDTYYICMPLFHANAMFMQLYSSLIVGARVVLSEKFSASKWIKQI